MNIKLKSFTTYSSITGAGRGKKKKKNKHQEKSYSLINKILSFKTTDFCLPLNYSWYIIAATVNTPQVPTSGRNATSNMVGKGWEKMEGGGRSIVLN